MRIVVFIIIITFCQSYADDNILTDKVIMYPNELLQTVTQIQEYFHATLTQSEKDLMKRIDENINNVRSDMQLLQSRLRSDMQQLESKLIKSQENIRSDMQQLNSRLITSQKQLESKLMKSQENIRSDMQQLECRLITSQQQLESRLMTSQENIRSDMQQLECSLMTSQENIRSDIQKYMEQLITKIEGVERQMYAANIASTVITLAGGGVATLIYSQRHALLNYANYLSNSENIIRK
jgi:biotin operon repressor